VAGPGGRRAARERALGLLYEAEVKDQPVGKVLAELPLVPQPYALALAEGVEQHQQRIDQVIADHAIDWSLERMAAVDRAIVRIATFELGWRPDIPTSVAISEAVELAKAYSTEESSRFVNGLLGAISRELRPEEYKITPRP
jgi:N utilization substance protein B